MNKFNYKAFWKGFTGFFEGFISRPSFTTLDVLLIIFALASNSWWIAAPTLIWFMIITPIFFTSKYSVEKKAESKDEHSQL